MCVFRGVWRRPSRGAAREELHKTAYSWRLCVCEVGVRTLRATSSQLKHLALGGDWREITSCQTSFVFYFSAVILRSSEAETGAVRFGISLGAQWRRVPCLLRYQLLKEGQILRSPHRITLFTAVKQHRMTSSLHGSVVVLA